MDCFPTRPALLAGSAHGIRSRELLSTTIVFVLIVWMLFSFTFAQRRTITPLRAGTVVAAFSVCGFVDVAVGLLREQATTL